MGKAVQQNLRCMMCGYEYAEQVEPNEDKERSCPKCRSNSIRLLKAGAGSGSAKAKGKGGKE